MKPTPRAILSPEQIALYREQGFVSVPTISPPEEVAALRETLHRLFAEKAGRKEGAQFDMVSADDENATPKLAQILMPVNFAPELRDTEFRANAFELAKQLIGPDAVPAFEHAILKPAGYGAPTPWHQDEAYRDEDFEYQQLSIWMPLQEATLENGCMQYIPGTHKIEVLTHHSPNKDTKVHALECCGDFDPATAVACPLPPGGAVIHHGRTLHYASANGSATPRLAYILAFELPPKPMPTGRHFSWNHEKATARLQRRQRWQRRGGILVMVWRKLRASWRNPAMLAYRARTAMRKFLGRGK